MKILDELIRDERIQGDRTADDMMECQFSLLHLNYLAPLICLKNVFSSCKDITMAVKSIIPVRFRFVLVFFTLDDAVALM